MTRIKAAALTLSATALLILLVAIAVLQSCGVDRFKGAQSSPSGQYEAVLIENDTGAPGPFISIVSVSEINPSFITRLLRRGRETVFGVDLSATHVSFRWAGINDLLITCDKCDPSKVLVRKQLWKDVRVSYQIYPSDASR
jgi:hypothetical protein